MTPVAYFQAVINDRKHTIDNTNFPKSDRKLFLNSLDVI